MKSKINEIAKVAAASVVSIGICGAVLLAANALAFAGVTERTVELEPLEAMSVTPVSAFAHASLSSTSQDGFAYDTNDAVWGFRETMGGSIYIEGADIYERDLPGEDALFVHERRVVIFESEVQRNPFGVIINGTYEDSLRGEDVLSSDEAVQIASQYIYEMFGECIDGSAVHMTFNGHMRHRGHLGIWTGTVGDGINDADENANDESVAASLGRIKFVFLLNATTGEMIHIEQFVGGLDGQFVTINPNESIVVGNDVRGRVFYVPDSFEGERRGDVIRRFVDGDFEVHMFNDELPEKLLEKLPERWRELIPDNFITRRFSLIPQTFGRDRDTAPAPQLEQST